MPSGAQHPSDAGHVLRLAALFIALESGAAKLARVRNRANRCFSSTWSIGLVHHYPWFNETCFANVDSVNIAQHGEAWVQAFMTLVKI